VVSTDPYSKVQAATLYSSGYAFVKRKCNVSQTFITKHSEIYIRQGDLIARGNVGGPKDWKSIVMVSHEAPAAAVLS
jgi:sulfur transfer complex TusBCD TusB component (DsrH family)